MLLLGGYGVFGARIAMALARDSAWDVVVAGRDLSAANRFAKVHGTRAALIDRDAADLSQRIAHEHPFAVVDAAGPFQDYGGDRYRVARAAVAAGAHYLDLSDDADFTRGITALDEAAREAGVAILSGVSSVPALSSAAVAVLSEGLTRIDLIDSVILPGNRAPRGLSVVRAIVGQAGRPLRVLLGGTWVDVPAWSAIDRVDLAVAGRAPLKGRWASFIGAPDIDLFPEAFDARSVLFRAGLELKIMHGGLAMLAQLVRWGLVATLAPMAPLLKRVADWLEPFGSDRGGMRVAVVGRDSEGRIERRTWTLVAEAGDGPHVPAVPARVLLVDLAAAKVAAGARPAIAVFPLAAAEAAMSHLSIAFGRTREAVEPLFAEQLGRDRWSTLPPALRRLHDVAFADTFAGMGEVLRGTGLAARLIGWAMGFPPAGRNVLVNVRMQRVGTDEVWVRDFAGRRFRSRISPGGSRGSGEVREHFGLLSFAIPLAFSDGALAYPVQRAFLLGVPLPRWLTPRSETHERVDEAGRACFDVRISMPGIGHVVSYMGWLEPVSDQHEGRPQI